MIEILSAGYLWVKALHLISVMAWMAGMLYLPRLFVYHCDAKPGTELSETLKLMERRLLRAIINPAMIAAWLFGIVMLYVDGKILFEPWMLVKFACALIMTGLHVKMAKWRKDFEEDKNKHSQKFYRILNEGPTVLLIAIVILVTVKPI